MAEHNRAARDVLTPMLGEAFADGIEAAASSGQFGAPLAQLALDYAFSGVWSRPGLDRRARSIVTMALMVATGQAREFKNHVRAGLANGLSAREIEELILHCAVYVGLPAAGIAMQAALEVLREHGLAADDRTAAERGLV